MHIEQSVKPVSPVFLRSDSNQFSQNKETFHDIFQRTLNHNSGTRPPKIELTGILIRLDKSASRPRCQFRLETARNEYVLRMSDTVFMLAKKLEWEEVTVKGYLDPEEGVFEVEKISLSCRSEPYRLSVVHSDLSFELDQYKKSIAQKGMLDVAPEYLVS